MFIRWNPEGHNHPIGGRLDVRVVWGFAVKHLVTVVLVVWTIGGERQVLLRWGRGSSWRLASTNDDMVVYWASESRGR